MGLLIIGLFTLILALIMWGAIWGTNKAMARLIGDKHRAMQIIIETGQVPSSWSAPFAARIARLNADPGNVSRVADLQAQARRHCLRKLDDLVRYAETTPLVDGEETRSLLLDQLTSLRAAVEAGQGADGICK